CVTPQLAPPTEESRAFASASRPCHSRLLTPQPARALYLQHILAEEVDMHSRPVGNKFAVRTALVATAVMSMLATSAFAQTTPELTVLSESDYSAGGARQFAVHSALVARDFVVVVSPPPTFGSWVSADLKAAGSQ